MANSDFAVVPAPARESFAWAALALLLLLLWQFITVRFNFGGNWTALFCTGQPQRIPPDLLPGTYLFANSSGYDGQMYRYVAHDPFMRRGYQSYVDAPRMRYRRILVPGLAFLLAAGRQAWIDQSYIAVTAVFVFLGAYWLSWWAALNGFHLAWGLAFLLVPASLVSIDRMTVDVSLAALCVAFVCYSKSESQAKTYAVLVFACLARETGVLLVVGFCIWEILAKRRRRAVFGAMAWLPTLAWYLFLETSGKLSEARAIPRWLTHRLGTGLVGRLLDPPRYPLSATLEWIARSADVAALAGILCALIAAAVLLRARPLSPATITAGLFALLAIVLTNERFWSSCYSYSRVFSPLLILIALEAAARWPLRRAWLWGLLPMALVDLRIGLQFGPQLIDVARGLLSH